MLSNSDVLVGNAHTAKYYATPQRLSAMQFVGVYDDALKAAGWTSTAKSPNTLNAAGASEGAQSSGHGRNALRRVVARRIHQGRDRVGLHLISGKRGEQ